MVVNVNYTRPCACAAGVAPAALAAHGLLQKSSGGRGCRWRSPEGVQGDGQREEDDSGARGAQGGGA